MTRPKADKPAPVKKKKPSPWDDPSQFVRVFTAPPTRPGGNR